jgi:hypothetical protein
MGSSQGPTSQIELWDGTIITFIRSPCSDQ